MLGVLGSRSQRQQRTLTGQARPVREVDGDCGRMTSKPSLIRLRKCCRQSGSYNVAARIEEPNITKTFHYNLRTLSLGLSFGGSEDL